VKREIYDITSEPKGELYRQLLTVALRHCDEFLFVDVPGPNYGENDTSLQAGARDLVQELRPHFVKLEKSKSWPGTILSEHPRVDVYARIHYFRLDLRSVAILARVADHLYAWRWPELPTDLCLLRPDGDAWLVNIAADEESYFQVTKEEAEELTRIMPELKVKRLYPQH